MEWNSTARANFLYETSSVRRKGAYDLNTFNASHIERYLSSWKERKKPENIMFICEAEQNY